MINVSSAPRIKNGLLSKTSSKSGGVSKNIVSSSALMLVAVLGNINLHDVVNESNSVYS